MRHEEEVKNTEDIATDDITDNSINDNKDTKHLPKWARIMIAILSAIIPLIAVIGGIVGGV